MDYVRIYSALVTPHPIPVGPVVWGLHNGNTVLETLQV